MSEYQYYEFLAVDRPLSEKEMAALRDLSTRARITPTSFVNHYNWGDFKGNPDRLMERMFDLFLYLANWGTRQLQIRFPDRWLDSAMVKPYCPGDSATLRQVKGAIILDYSRDPDDGGDWDWENDGQGWMASLAPLRTELLRNDRRMLYLGWLLAVQGGELEDDALEPPLPPGLADLTAPLSAFVDFMGIDRDLVEAAASGNAQAARKGLSRKGDRVGHPDPVRCGENGVPDAGGIGRGVPRGSGTPPAPGGGGGPGRPPINGNGSTNRRRTVGQGRGDQL